MTNTDPDRVSADARSARSYGMVALIIGRLGDMFGLRRGMFFLYITLGYILSIGLWAKPIIVNETIFRKMRKEAA